MKILVLGNIEQARGLFRQRPNGARQVHHCAKAVRVTRSFSPIDPPDWILIEGDAISTEGIALIQSLRTMGFSLSTVHPHQAADAQDMTPPIRCTGEHCGIERDDRGVMRLRCSLHQAMNQPPPAGAKTVAKQTEAALCFEYQAPPRRRNN